MFRHPRIERGNSGHGRPEDRTQRTSTSLELGAEDASHGTVDSMGKTSPQDPQPGKTSAEGIVCVDCHWSFTTKEDLHYHAGDCQLILRSFRDSQLLEERTKDRPPAASNSERSGEVSSPSLQVAMDTAHGSDNVPGAELPVQKKGERPSDEDPMLTQSRLKVRSWIETSIPFGGQDSTSHLDARRFQTTELRSLRVQRREASSPPDEVPCVAPNRLLRRGTVNSLTEVNHNTRVRDIRSPNRVSNPLLTIRWAGR